MVSDIQTRRVQDAPVPAFYVPWMSEPTRTLTILVDADHPNAVPQISDAIKGTAPGEPLVRAKRLGDLVSESIGDSRLYAVATVALSLLTLSIASIGLCGMVLHSIRGRAREVAVRAALGASPTNLVASIFQQSMLSIGLGTMCGLLVSLWAYRLFSHLLFGEGRQDLLPYVLTAAAVGLAGACTALPPALRILKTDIATTLREN